VCAHLEKREELKTQPPVSINLDAKSVTLTHAAWASVGSIHCALKLASSALCAASLNHMARSLPGLPRLISLDLMNVETARPARTSEGCILSRSMGLQNTLKKS